MITSVIDHEDGMEMKTIERGEELLTMEEVVEELGVSRSTLQNYIRAGRLTTFKPGKERRAFRRDVEALRDGSPRNYIDEPPEGAMNVDEMAEWLRYHPNHIRRLVNEADLPSYRVGPKMRLYFLKDEVLKWMRERSER